MTNYSIDSALTAAEGTINIDLSNKGTGTTYSQATVLGINTLGQILNEYALDLGLNPKDPKVIFENKRTGVATSDSQETVEGLGLQDGDVLAIVDNGGVA